MSFTQLGLDEDRRAEGSRIAEQRAITYEMGQQYGLIPLPTPTSGVTVSHYTAFQVSAWWNGINVIAGDIGVLDRQLYRRVGADDRERVNDHPVARVLDQPNEYMAPLTFWQTLMAHVLGWGNAYAEIEWDNALRPIALWPIMPTDIEPVCEVVVSANGSRRTRLYYRYLGQYRLEPEDVLHIPGLGFDGLRGYSVVALARQSLGLTVALERYGGAFFGNGAWPGLIFEHPKTLGTEAQARLRASVNGMHQGADNAFKVFVAEEGMKVATPVAVNPKEAQGQETREHQITEIARWLNLPPHKLKHKMGERPGANLETSERDYHTTTLLPWTTLIDQQLNRKVVSKAQRGTYYVEHNYQRRLQASALERSQIQKAYLDMGVLSAEQIARQENLPKPEKKKEPAPAPAALAPPPDANPPDAPDSSQNGNERSQLSGVMLESALYRLVKDTEVAVERALARLDAAPAPVAAQAAPEPQPPAIVNVDVLPAQVAPPHVTITPRAEITAEEFRRIVDAISDGVLEKLPPPPASAPSLDRAEVIRPVALDAAGRFVRREAAAATKAAKKGPAEFQAWAEDFYARESDILRDSLEPVVSTALLLVGAVGEPRVIARDIADGYAARSKAELLALPAKDLATAVSRLLERWETARVVEMADKIAAVAAGGESDAA